MIAQLNNITDVEKIPTNRLIIVPVTNCSCSGQFYQHNSTYDLKYSTETYFSLANNTYQGLTTCQSLINQNPYDARKLVVGTQLSIPLRCACPTRNQTANGVKYLLSYLVTWGDSISAIGENFGVDEESINSANLLSDNDLIFPFTPVLVPLKAQPRLISIARKPPPPPPPSPTINVPTPTVNSSNSSSSKTKMWLFIGIGVGSVLLLALLGVLLALLGFFLWFVCYRRPSQPVSQGKMVPVSSDYTSAPERNYESSVVTAENVRLIMDSVVKVYNFEDLQKATGYFSEDKRISGSVYLGVIKGDNAAIKRVKGDAVNEINILKQISHSSVVRLSGYCMHEGNAYLVYEFVENGSLSDLLHESESCETPTVRLEWKQRVQIAYDVADGLNYLHNYANPPYIHKNLKSSNILLNGGFRAKIINFGMARTAGSEEEGEKGLQLTRHVVGTQGYMAPEYMKDGVVTPKMDVFAFGVVMLELLSGKEAVTFSDANGNDGKNVNAELLLLSINQVLEGENVREKLKIFIDPSLRGEYPLDLAFSVAQLAKNCVAKDLNSRPSMFDVFISLSKILSSSLDWDPSDELETSTILSR
ncbi:hypothetical protein IFM89_030377 [Coptis chinensis]|uniref:Uncharacterized protein n=1 Tax=Coptis chinensis TaxID=261450 RepID=A0A835LD22_9MAGN|nr:hypothetical protein IFM89_030377 [Coptis chinensis]